MATIETATAEWAEQERIYRETTRHQGYTLAELHEAFDRVKNAKNWKLEILATVTPAAVPILNVAIPFFTGSTPSYRAAVVKRASDKGLMVVRADGYYAAIGA